MSDFPYKEDCLYIFKISPHWNLCKVEIVEVTKETVFFLNKDTGQSRRVLHGYFLENFKLIEEIA